MPTHPVVLVALIAVSGSEVVRSSPGRYPWPQWGAYSFPLSGTGVRASLAFFLLLLHLNVSGLAVAQFRADMEGPLVPLPRTSKSLCLVLRAMDLF